MNENPLLEAGFPRSHTDTVSPPPFWKRLINVLRNFVTKKEEPLDCPYTFDEIGALFKAITKADEGCIDDQTWKDLDLNAYSEKLSPQISIFGQQTIHLRLRKGVTDTECEVAADRYRMLQEDKVLCSQLRETFQPLRGLNVEVSGIVFGKINLNPPWWMKGLWPFQILTLLAVGGSITSLAWLSTLCVLVILLFAAQASWNTEVERFAPKLETLRTMLRVAKDLAILAKTKRYPSIQEFPKELADIERVSGVLTRSTFETEVPGAMLYADWFLLLNIRHHFRAIETIKQSQLFLQRCYQLIGDLEADLAVAQHLSHEGRICWAARHSSNTIAFTEVVNPLLLDAAPLSIKLDGKGAFLSGQNGSGKSTFLRTLGINLVVGRAFGFCYAIQAGIPAVPVYTSIQIEDSMSGGESLYIAELRRARELLNSSNGIHKGVYIIDEIFRGTNHLESVSAAAAVIHALAQNALVIVSSHNLVLSALLEKWLTPLRVESHGTTLSNITITPGVLDDPNGIALLSSTGFDSRISANANSVLSWLSGYLAHPRECPDILQA